MRIIDISHALWLHHIDLLRKMLIEKGIINIKLTNSPLAIECNAKHNTNGDRIYQGTKSLMKVNVRILVKSFSNKPSFIMRNRAVWILFDAKHPFVAYYILPRAQGNQSPIVVQYESIIFFLHSLEPFGISESFGNSAGLGDIRNSGGETIFGVAFDDGIFREGLHGMMGEWERGRRAPDPTVQQMEKEVKMVSGGSRMLVN